MDGQKTQTMKYLSYSLASLVVTAAASIRDSASGSSEGGYLCIIPLREGRDPEPELTAIGTIPHGRHAEDIRWTVANATFLLNASTALLSANMDDSRQKRGGAISYLGQRDFPIICSFQGFSEEMNEAVSLLICVLSDRLLSIMTPDITKRVVSAAKITCPENKLVPVLLAEYLRLS